MLLGAAAIATAAAGGGGLASELEEGREFVACGVRFGAVGTAGVGRLEAGIRGAPGKRHM